MVIVIVFPERQDARNSVTYCPVTRPGPGDAARLRHDHTRPRHDNDTITIPVSYNTPEY